MQFTFFYPLLLVCVLTVVGSQYTSSRCSDFGCFTNGQPIADETSQARSRSHNLFNPYSSANRREYHGYHHEPPIPVPVPIPYSSKGYVVLPTLPKQEYKPQGYGYNHRLSSRQYVQNAPRVQSYPSTSYSHNQRHGYEVRRPQTFGSVSYQASASNQNPLRQQLPAPTRTQSQYVVAPSYERKSASENYYQNPLSYSDSYFASSQRPYQSYNSGNRAVEQQPQSAKYQEAENLKYGGWTPVAPATEKSNAFVNKARNNYPYSNERLSNSAREEANYLSKSQRPYTNSVDYTPILERASTVPMASSQNYRSNMNEGILNSQYFEEYDSDESAQKSPKVPVEYVTLNTEAETSRGRMKKEDTAKEQKYEDNLRVGKIPDIAGDRLVYPDYAKRKSLENTKRKQPVRFTHVRERRVSSDYV